MFQHCFAKFYRFHHNSILCKNFVKETSTISCPKKNPRFKLCGEDEPKWSRNLQLANIVRPGDYSALKNQRRVEWE